MSREQVDGLVRPYEPRDRQRVREICHATGYMGESAGWFWPDVESFADMFSGYYTDEEPSSAHVVEIDGRVEGYLLGCLDSSKAWQPDRVLLRHVLRRGIAFRRGTSAFFGRAAVDLYRDRRAGLRRATQPDGVEERYPAHLHIDLMPVARGQGFGRQLVAAWLAQVEAAGLDGCHLRTFAQNTGGISFFLSVGFRRFGEPAIVPGWRSTRGERLHTQTMVIDLDRSGDRDAAPNTQRGLGTAPRHD